MDTQPYPRPDLRGFRQCLEIPSVAELSYRRENIVPLLIIGGAYLLSGACARCMAIPDGNVGAFWLPAGIGVAAVVLKGKRAVWGIVLGALILNVISMRSILVSVSIAGCAASEAIFGACLATRFADVKSAFASPADYLKFVFLSGGVNAALFGTLGAAVLYVGGLTPPGQFWLSWLRWWSGDALGIILVAPFLILLFSHKHHSFDFQGAMEIVCLLVTIIIVCCINFGPALSVQKSNVGIEFFCIPLLLWASVRFCPLEACGASLLVGSFALWGSLHGYGPFGSPISHSVLRTCFVLVVVVTTMAGSIAWARLQKQLEEMVFLNVVLQERLKSGSDPE